MQRFNCTKTAQHPAESSFQRIAKQRELNILSSKKSFAKYNFILRKSPSQLFEVQSNVTTEKGRPRHSPGKRESSNGRLAKRQSDNDLRNHIFPGRARICDNRLKRRLPVHSLGCKCLRNIVQDPG